MYLFSFDSKNEDMRFAIILHKKMGHPEYLGMTHFFMLYRTKMPDYITWQSLQIYQRCICRWKCGAGSCLEQDPPR